MSWTSTTPIPFETLVTPPLRSGGPELYSLSKETFGPFEPPIYATPPSLPVPTSPSPISISVGTPSLPRVQRHVPTLGRVAVRGTGKGSGEMTLGNTYVVDLRVMLGRGKYGQVYSGYVVGDRTNLLAIKKVHFDQRTENRVILETDILFQLQGHPHIVRIYAAMKDKEAGLLWIVMPKYDGDLRELLYPSKIQRFRLTEQQSTRILFQFVQTVSDIHRRGICHWDLRLDNVFVKYMSPLRERGPVDIIIGDFGIAFYDGPVCGLENWDHFIGVVLSVALSPFGIRDVKRLNHDLWYFIRRNESTEMRTFLQKLGRNVPQMAGVIAFLHRLLTALSGHQRDVGGVLVGHGNDSYLMRGAGQPPVSAAATGKYLVHHVDAPEEWCPSEISFASSARTVLGSRKIGGSLRATGGGPIVALVSIKEMGPGVFDLGHLVCRRGGDTGLLALLMAMIQRRPKAQFRARSTERYNRVSALLRYAPGPGETSGGGVVFCGKT